MIEIAVVGLIFALGAWVMLAVSECGRDKELIRLRQYVRDTQSLTTEDLTKRIEGSEARLREQLRKELDLNDRAIVAKLEEVKALLKYDCDFFGAISRIDLGNGIARESIKRDAGFDVTEITSKPAKKGRKK